MHGSTALERAQAVLRDVIRSGGVDNLSHLMSHGHNRLTVYACERHGWLRSTGSFRYEITHVGRTAGGEE